MKLKNAAKIPPRQLSGESARALYGDELRLSPSRVEKFAGCRFAYFLNYGLRAKPRRPAQFRAPEAGSFIHYILQHVAEETQGSGGLEGASDDRLDELCDEYSMRYLTEELGGLEGKSARFAYLFARLAESVRRIVQDMAEELRASEFKPLSFELDLSRPGPAARGGAAGRRTAAAGRRGGQGGRLGPRRQAVPAGSGLQDREQELLALGRGARP